MGPSRKEYRIQNIEYGIRKLMPRTPELNLQIESLEAAAGKLDALALLRVP
jgi:hypothetical protein